MDQTKVSTMAQLYEKYVGPTFTIHYKYSYIMVYVFMAFTWGGLVPMIFVLSTIGISVMFVVERMMVYYAYTHPPMLDTQMMEQALNMLYCAPFGLCFAAAWAFSNRSIYFDEVAELDKDTVYPQTGHEMGQFLDTLSPATPLVIFGIWLFLYGVLAMIRPTDPLFFEQTFQQDFSKMRDVMKRMFEFRNSKEDRPTWTERQTKEQNLNRLSELRTQVDRLGIKKEDISNLNDLKSQVKNKYKGKESKNVQNMGRGYCYDILANPLYMQKFCYVPTWEQGRLNYIASPNVDENFERIAAKGQAKNTEHLYMHETEEEQWMALSQSDYVRWMLELAYIPKKQAMEDESTTMALAKKIIKQRKDI